MSEMALSEMPLSEMTAKTPPFTWAGDPTLGYVIFDNRAGRVPPLGPGDVCSMLARIKALDAIARAERSHSMSVEDDLLMAQTRIEALERERDADWRKFLHLRDDNERIRVLGEELAEKGARIEALEGSLAQVLMAAADPSNRGSMTQRQQCELMDRLYSLCRAALAGPPPAQAIGAGQVGGCQ